MVKPFLQWRNNSIRKSVMFSGGADRMPRTDFIRGIDAMGDPRKVCSQ